MCGNNDWVIRLVHDPMFYPGVGPFTGRITKHEERPGKGRPLPNAPGTCRTHRQSTSGPAHRNGGHRPGAEQYCYHRTATTTGVVMALSRQGLIDLPSAIALVLGGNLGTCITAVLASIGGTTTGKRGPCPLKPGRCHGLSIPAAPFLRPGAANRPLLAPPDRQRSNHFQCGQQPGHPPLHPWLCPATDLTGERAVTCKKNSALFPALFREIFLFKINDISVYNLTNSNIFSYTFPNAYAGLCYDSG